MLNTEISNNTFFSNDTSNGGNGEIALTYSSNCSFINNIIYATNKRILSDQWGGGTSPSLSFNYNMYYSLSGTAANILFDINGDSYTGLTGFKSGSSQDANSTFQNPLLISNATGNPNLRLTSSSPARDAGKPGIVAGINELDIDGENRIDNSRIDIGAHEYQVTLGIIFNDDFFNNDFEHNKNYGWSIYPNPVINYFKVEDLKGKESIQKVYVFTPEMKYIELSPTNASEYIIPENIGPGLFTVIIETDTERIVKKNNQILKVLR